MGGAEQGRRAFVMGNPNQALIAMALCLGALLVFLFFLL
jgi:hypothetical protein